MIRVERAVRGPVIALILISCVGCDQITKQFAEAQLKGQQTQSFLGDLFRLEYAENPGAFLGLGGQLSPSTRWFVLIVLNALMTATIAIFLTWRWNMDWLRLVACTLLLSGAVGNLIDRVRLDGLVIDFLNFGVGPLRTGIFNVADMALMAGAVLWMVLVSTRERVVSQP